MVDAQIIKRDKQLGLEAEILRHLWHEGQATPAVLSGTLNQSLPLLQDCLEDLIRRQCVYQFFPSPNGWDASVYCLTRKAQRRLQAAFMSYSRYKLKSFWDALKREQQLWTAHLQL